MMAFKDRTIEERKAVYERIKVTHPDRIPLLMYPSKDTNFEALKSEK